MSRSLKKILIIEDNAELVRALERMLEHFKYETITALTGSDGLRLLATTDMDLILCDINLPDMSGIDILKAVRANKAFHMVPFIFLTAYATDRDRMRGMNEGADDYITKPFEIRKLVDVIRARVAISERKKMYLKEELNDKWMRIINHSYKQEFLKPLNGLLNAAYLIESAPSATTSGDLKDTINAIYVSSFRVFRNTRNLIIFSIIKQYEELSFIKNTAQGSVFVSDIILQIVDYYNNGLTYNWGVIYPHLEHVSIQSTDSEYLSVIFTELIDNGVKHDAQQCVPEITLTADNNQFVFTVTNNIGPGFGLKLDDVTPFYKKGDDESHAGLGLGLYICVKLCQKLNYTLAMTKSDGKISFTVSNSAE